tara:strand:+ start:50 stop:1159 length:1110 start_codon:yes stop_codon:yes gene_type:complete
MAKQDFRFFDSRQKYLLFVTTTNEKQIIADHLHKHIKTLKPKKPALKIFDAGLGDGSLLISTLRSCHKEFPTIPFVVFAKEISMEDVRIGIEKLPNIFMEHPNTIFVVTNLHYSEAATLESKNEIKQKKINWETVKLKGDTSYEFFTQLNKLDNLLQKNWQVERHPTSGNPTYKTPSALIIYRDDQSFPLNHLIPIKNKTKENFDLILASQPYRSRIKARKKNEYVIKPMIDALSKNGKLVVVHASGKDPAYELIKKIWPNENPFPTLGKKIYSDLKSMLSSNELQKLKFNPIKNIKYSLRALPEEISNGISTSIIFSAWNASTYVTQMNDDEVLKIEKKFKHIKPTQKIIKKYGGLWFNDELIVIEKK